jgi:hypothetical protein
MTSVRSIQTFLMLVGVAMSGAPMMAVAAPAATANIQLATPSRAAEKGCKWERFSDAKLGLDAWVQRCDFSKRKIDFVTVKNSLAQRWSDSNGATDPVVDVLNLKAGETPEQGIRRLFVERTDKKLAAQCVLAPFRDREIKTPAGVNRYVFVPKAAYRKELKRKEVPGDIPEPPCGDWGYSADGIAYFEAQPRTGAQKVLFVRYGQDTPLFDEATLRLE